MDPILEIEHLSKTYANFALQDISFSLPRGYIMGLIGPNGAGKTTIIRLIMNLIARQSGQIRLFGLDNRIHELAIKERIGFVYDAPDFYDHLTAAEMKGIVARFYKQWDESHFLRLMKRFDLPLGQKIKTLSHGMKMKFALALALAHHAELIIMDEPTSGLDPVFRREILEILAETIEEGERSILFSSHITSDLERIADFITFIHQGRLVFSESKEEILEHWRIVKGASDFLTKDTTRLFRGVRRHEYGFTALTDQSNDFTDRQRRELVEEKASFEDIVYFTVKGDQP